MHWKLKILLSNKKQLGLLHMHTGQQLDRHWLNIKLLWRKDFYWKSCLFIIGWRQRSIRMQHVITYSYMFFLSLAEGNSQSESSNCWSCLSEEIYWKICKSSWMCTHNFLQPQPILMEELNPLTVLRSRGTAYLNYNLRYVCLSEEIAWKICKSSWMYTHNFPQTQPILMINNSNERTWFAECF